MKAGECLLGLAHAVRGGMIYAAQAQHPILQQHAKLCSSCTGIVPQLQSLASLACVCRSLEDQPARVSVAHSVFHSLCMPLCSQRQALRHYHGGTQTASVPTLKQRLRELMMLVHPDRWSAHPTARRENERSFKLLNEYLEAAKAGGTAAMAAGPAYHFVFYLQQQQPGELSDDEAEHIADEPLQRVAISLPPAARQQEATGDELPLTTSRALAKLLDACGLNSEFSGGVEGSSRLQRLRTFMPYAAEQTRQAQHDAGSPLEVDIVRSALKMTRQCTVGFGGKLRHQSRTKQLQAVKQLASILDAISDNVSGIQFMLGDRNGTDDVGRVWLDAAADHQEWARHLSSIDLAACRARQAQMRRVRQLEDQAATALGISAVFAEDERLAMLPSFSDLLQRALADCAEHGKVGGGRLTKLPLRVQRHGYRADAVVGLLAVPVSATAAQLRKHIEDHGDAVLSVQRQHEHQQQAVQRLQLKVKSLLRLRRLSIDPGIESRQAVSCLERLAHHHLAISSASDGLSLRISHANRMSPDGATVDIAWNFEM